MANYIIGSGTSRFYLINNSSRTGSTQIIDLPLTNSNGLTISWEEVSIKHLLISQRRMAKKILGWTVKFTLDYSEYIQKNDLIKIKTIIDSARAGWTLRLVPRVDDLSSYYDVYYSGQSLDINILHGGTNAIGNKSVVLEFTTIDLQPSLNFTDPDLVPYSFATIFPRTITI